MGDRIQAGNGVQPKEHLPSMQEAFGSIPTTTQKAKCGSAHLQSQHIGSGGERVSSARSSLVTYRVGGTAGSQEIMP